MVHRLRSSMDRAAVFGTADGGSIPLEGTYILLRVPTACVSFGKRRWQAGIPFKRTI